MNRKIICFLSICLKIFKYWFLNYRGSIWIVTIVYYIEKNQKSSMHKIKEQNKKYTTLPIWAYLDVN